MIGLPFDPYNFDYKAYMLEMYNITEMPQRADRDKFMLDDITLNQQDGIRVEKNTQRLDDYKAGDQVYRLFFEEENEGGTYYLLDMDRPFISVEYSFDRIITPIKGIENKAIWNHRWAKGLARYFFRTYVAEKEPVIASDHALTDRGFKFWKVIFDECVRRDHSHKMYVMDFTSGTIVKQIGDEKEMEEYFGSNQSKYRFVMEKI
jgi:hypothetical protein